MYFDFRMTFARFLLRYYKRFQKLFFLDGQYNLAGKRYSTLDETLLQNQCWGDIVRIKLKCNSETEHDYCWIIQRI